MLKNDLIMRNPLRLLEGQHKTTLREGEFGAVVARAGVGKTAFLVQIAMDSLLNGRNVLHISLDQPVKKVCLWYEEVFHHIARQYDFKNTDELWEAILPHRFIMTFNRDTFDVAKLEERLGDITEQGIFYPQMVLVDGLLFDETVREALDDFKLLAKSQGFPVWFTAKSHREEKTSREGLPESVSRVADLFTTVFQLVPSDREIEVQILKGGSSGDENGPGIVLDPSTLLITSTEKR